MVGAFIKDGAQHHNQSNLSAQRFPARSEKLGFGSSSSADKTNA